MNPADLFKHSGGTINVPAGEALFREGDAGKLAYVLLEGTIDILVGDEVVETAGSGALLGEMALIDDSARSASAIATSPCRLVGLDAKLFKVLVQQTPDFSIHVMKVLVQRLRNMDRRMTGGRRS